MRVYTIEAPLTNDLRELVETACQLMPSTGPTIPNARRPGILVPHRLLIAALLAIPRGERYGVGELLSDAFNVSRTTIYDIRDRINGHFDIEQALDSAAELGAAGSAGNRFGRLILTMLMPGGMSYRPMRHCLMEAFGEPRSLGFISGLVNCKGERAGRILKALQWEQNPHEITLSRDETYFDGLPMLMMVEPGSLAIRSGQVKETADGEGWAIELTAVLEGYGPCRINVAEDGASYFPSSLVEAEHRLEEADIKCVFEVQKDWHHIFDAARRLQAAVDRPALAALEKAARYESPGPGESMTAISDVDAWQAAKAKAEPLVAFADEVRFWLGCLHDAFKMVDWQSGCIRDLAINRWLLGETIAGLRALEDERTDELVTTLVNQQSQLLTYMGWLEERLPAWRQEALDHFEEGELAEIFERAAARVWYLRRALTNGHRRMRPAAEWAEAELEALIGDDGVSRQLADRLIELLDAVVRTSSASECIHSILKPMLWAHRQFTRIRSAQNWLNLFVLWHNMRRFERGRRAGKSPFELAGVTVYTPDARVTDDWLEVLGLPAAA